MKKLFKMLCMALAAALTVSAFAGCTNTPATSSETPAPTSSADQPTESGEEPDPFAEPMEISIASWDLITEGDPDPFYQEILDKFNISIKAMSTSWEDYISKIQTWCAGGSTIPDLFSIDAVGQPFYSTWVKEGVVKQIPDDLSAYPNLKALMDMADTAAYKDNDGHYYCIPKPNYANNVLWGLEKGVYVRKDWMEAAGITKDPENMDEFVSMLNTIIEKNPGKSANLVGVTAQNPTHFFSLMLNYAPEVACGMNYWVKADDNSWMPGIFTDRTKSGLLALNELYKGNLLDRDLPTIKDTDGIDKFMAGNAVVLCAAPNLVESFMDSFAQINGDVKFEDCVKLLKPWKAENGKTYRFATLSHWAETYIGGNCDDAKRDRILAFYDYMLGDGLNAMRFGEEGKDYTKDGDKITITRPTGEDGSFVGIETIHPQLRSLMTVFTWDGDFALVNPAGNERALAFQNEYADWLAANTEPVETNFQLTYMPYENSDKAIADPTDEMIKVVMNDDAAAAYDAMIATLKGNGYDAAIAGFNAAAKAAGIE